MYKNQYYICLKQKHQQINLQEILPEQNFALDYSLDYFAKVFQAMEKEIEVDNLVFYLTRDLQQLPSYGQNVVAIVVGDEWYRRPSYVHKVRAIFKCFGTYPIINCKPLLKPSYLNLLTWIQLLRIWLIRLPNSLNYRLNQLKNWLPCTTTIAPIYEIPIGYYKQFKLPIKDINNRKNDVFFDGSLFNKPPSKLSLKYWFSTPKKFSRQTMIELVEQIGAKHPDWQIKLSVTDGFHETTPKDTKYYCQAMMDSKICLAPRGSTFETFRLFEGLRYGCIVVREFLPSRWYFEGLPAIEITDWRQLEGVLEQLLNNPQLLQQKHQESLNYWKNQCSEAAVGAYMAQKLNETQPA